MKAFCFTSLFCIFGFLVGVDLRSDQLPRSTPKAQGVLPKKILDFISEVDERQMGIHNFILVRNGFVITEASWMPYEKDDDHMLFSLSKSFTSTAIGLAIDEGLIELSDPVIKFFPDDLPKKVGWKLRSMRIQDLLSMSSGHHSDDLRRFSFDSEESLTRQFLHLSVAHKPGTYFLYNTPATYMCSAILQKVTGEGLLDYLKPRLFSPLGIDAPRWSESAQGIAHGGFGLSISTEDIAKFGQLYLQNGNWKGRQLVPVDWVKMATSRQSSNGSNPKSDWEQGYGFQFWLSRHNAYRGDGAFGQFCVIMPDQNAVIAITSGTQNMHSILGLIWKHLLPAFDEIENDHNVQTDHNVQNDQKGIIDASTQKLKDRIRHLSLPTIHQSADLNVKALPRFSNFELDKNDLKWKSMSFKKLDSEKYEYVFAFDDGDETYEIGCSPDVWKRDETRFSIGIVERIQDRILHPIATTGGWISGDEFMMKLVYTETPLVIEMKFDFEAEGVSVEIKQSASFGKATFPIIKGIATR